MIDDFAWGMRTRVQPLIETLNLFGWHIDQRALPVPRWRGAGFDALFIRSANEMIARRDAVGPGDEMRQVGAETGTVEEMVTAILKSSELRPASEIRAVRPGS